MNALCYKVIFSKRLGALVAVGENATSQGKSASGAACRTVVAPTAISTSSTYSNYVGAVKSLFVASTLACVTASPSWAAPDANALPTNGVVQTGAATISTNGAAMTINQATQKASINWNSFSIGKDASVNVVQNNASSVLLNRVVGNDPSQIFGKLTANGQVILINPNGIVFGKGGSVTASAFTASTFGMTDADFSAGKHKFTRNGSTAGVTVEDGATISTTAPSGYVALMGASVDNQGAITTQGGAVVLASGETVALPAGLTDNISVPLSGKVRLELLPSTLNAMVANSGTITTEGGQVLMQAAAVSDAVASIAHTGTIDTTGEQGGAVTLRADNGDIKVSGVVKANSKSTKNKGGNIIIGRDEVTGVLAKATNVSGAVLESKGGFVETSGHDLNVDGAKVFAKDWLLDPDNIDITGDATAATAGYSKIKASDIETNLKNGTSVTVSTTSGVTVTTPPIGYTAANSGDGNILVNAAINKNSGGNATLTLLADNGITLNQKIQGSSNNGTLDVTLKAGGNATNTANSAGIYVTSAGGIDTNGKVVIDSTTKYTGSWDYKRSALTMNTGAVIRGSDVDIKLNVGMPSGTAYKVFGAFLQNGTTLEATAGNLAIDSTITRGANSSSSTAMTFGSNFGSAVYLKATGNVSLTADWTGNAGTGGGIGLVDTKISAGGNILVDSKVNAPTVTAISTGNGGNGLGFSAVSTGNGDVTFKANQGAIYLDKLTAAIKGRNVTIDNTGDSTGTSTRTDIAGVTIKSNTGVKGIEATGNVNIVGSNNAGTQSGVALTGNSEINGQNVTINGTSLNANGVFSAAVIKATTGTGGDINITGVSSGSPSTASALSLQGDMTASNNVVINGNNTNAGNTAAAVYINKVVTATNGKVDVTASTSGATANALWLVSGANLTGKTEVNIKTDTLSIASGATVNSDASTGKVTIKTDSTDAKINIVSNDLGSQNTGSRTLGLSVAELSSITAGNTVIGDIATHTGGITVSGATSTATATGNITLETGGKIDVKNTLSAANDKNLTLKAIGDINVDSTISQGGAGNIVLAAGFGKVAGDRSGVGQVKRAGTGAVSNTSGKTYIYTGTVADSAKMSDLNNAFNTLTLSGPSANAKSFTDSNGTNTIGSTATMQVMYREKIAVDLTDNSSSNGVNNNLNAKTTYGSVNKANVDTDANNILKTVNNNKTLTWSENGNNFSLSSNALIDTLSIGGLSNSSYSSANKLKASDTPYTTESTTYRVATGKTLPTLEVTKKDITTTSIAGVSDAVYGTSKATGEVTLGTDLIYGDKVVATNTATVKDAATSSSGNLKAGSYKQTVAAGLSSTDGTDDASNYSFAGKTTDTANYVVGQKSLTALYVANNKVFDGNTNATLASATLKDVEARDVVTHTNTGASFDTAAVGTNKTVTVAGIKLNGADAANYKVASTTTTTNKPSITAVPVPPPTPVVPTNTGNRVKIPVGSSNPFALASAEDLADDTCTANSIENCYCEESTSNQGVDICYEPKAGAKGSVR